MHHASCIAGRRLRFSMLTALTNIRSTKVGGRRPSVEDDLQWKMIFVEGRPLVEDDLQWKMTFFGRRPLVEENLWGKGKTIFSESLHAAYSASGHFFFNGPQPTGMRWIECFDSREFLILRQRMMIVPPSTPFNNWILAQAALLSIVGWSGIK